MKQYRIGRHRDGKQVFQPKTPVIWVLNRDSRSILSYLEVHLQREGASCWRSKQGLVQVEGPLDQFGAEVEQHVAGQHCHRRREGRRGFVHLTVKFTIGNIWCTPRAGRQWKVDHAALPSSSNNKISISKQFVKTSNWARSWDRKVMSFTELFTRNKSPQKPDPLR